MEIFIILFLVALINGIGLHVMVKQTNRLANKMDSLQSGYNTMVERYWTLLDMLVAHIGKEE